MSGAATLEHQAGQLGDGAYTKAAHLYRRAQQTIADELTDDATAAQADDAERAIANLEERFPSIRDMQDPDEWAQAMSGNPAIGSRRKRKSSPKSPQASPQGGDRSPRRRPAPSRQRAAGRRRSGRATAFGAGLLLGRHSAVEQTGLPGAARTTTSTVLATLGGIIGLAIVYNLLTAGRAPSLFLQGAGELLDRIFGMADPLAPFSAQAKAAAAATSPGQTIADAVDTGLGPILDDPAGQGALAGAAVSQLGAATGSAAAAAARRRALTHGARTRQPALAKRRLFANPARHRPAH